MDEKSFEALEDSVESLTNEDERAPEVNPGPDLPAYVPIHSEADFKAAARAALHALPAEVENQLGGVAITVSDDGAANHGGAQPIATGRVIVVGRTFASAMRWLYALAERAATERERSRA